MTYEEKSAVVIQQLREDRDRLLNAIDKIRAEIEEQKHERCFDEDNMIVYRTGLDDALEIIDKYIKNEE